MDVGWDFYRRLCWRRSSLLDIKLDFPKTLSTPIRHSWCFVYRIGQSRFFVLADLRFHCGHRFDHLTGPRIDQCHVPEFTP